MSVWAKTWAYEQHPRRVGEDGNVTDKKHPAAKAVLVALAEFPGPGQRDCWPSQDTLADMTDFTERQVRACLSDLEAQGLIKRQQRRRKDGSRRSDRITLLGPLSAFGPNKQKQDADDLPEESAGSQPEESSEQPEESSGHEPSLSTNRGVEANASSGKPQTSKPVPMEKYVTDRFYEAMREAKYRLPNSEYPYHLGRAQDMLSKDSPTDEEVEELPAAFVRLWTIKGKADAPAALSELRRQKARTAQLAEGAARPDEPINPHGERGSKAKNEARAAFWYVSSYEASWETVEALLARGLDHDEMCRELEGGVSGAA
jgi:hypothetical protein